MAPFSSAYANFVLWGAGISQLMFIIKPCAQLAPHHHPRADELLTLIQGASWTPSLAPCCAAVQGLCLKTYDAAIHRHYPDVTHTMFLCTSMQGGERRNLV